MSEKCSHVLFMRCNFEIMHRERPLRTVKSGDSHMCPAGSDHHVKARETRAVTWSSVDELRMLRVRVRFGRGFSH